MATVESREVDFNEIASRALVTAQKWSTDANSYPTNRAAKLLGEVLEDETGLDFTVSFVDGVIRPEDIAVAAATLEAVGRQNPRFLPWFLRTPAYVGGAASRFAPKISVPTARKVFAKLVGDLVVDVSEDKLGPAIARLKSEGARLNMNLLGEAVLGDREAQKRLRETKGLLARDDVDYVSLKVSAVTGPHNPWGYEAVVEHAVNELLPLYQYAASQPTPKFINLDMEEYHDLHLTVDVFKKILDRDELLSLEAGIVLQTYLPDTLTVMQDLQEWAAARVARGGAPVKVRVVKGANLAMERVDALMHGWPLTTWDSKQATDANYMRILEWSLTPERVKNIRIGVAGHNLFTIAAAWELAQARGCTDGMEVEMLSGMATQQASAVRKDVGNLLLYVPVVRPEEYDVAISYLVRRLEENAADENFMASIFDIGTEARSFDKEKERFLKAVAQMLAEGESRVGPTRTQNRSTETREELEAAVKDTDGNWVFTNTPDSDPALPANVEWAREIAAKVNNSTVGVDTVEANTYESKEALDQVLSALYESPWHEKTAAERAEILHQAGVELALRRAELIEVAGSELGKGLDQTDVEVSEAIDFAHYYAQQALELDNLDGAIFTAEKLALITPPWNFPLAIPAGGVLAALAAGSSAILKPAPESRRCGAVIAEALWAAGVPKDALALVIIDDETMGKDLVTDSRIGRVVLTGASSTAELFRSWDPTTKIMAETSGKNSIIITPSADLDLAVKDVVQSAFGHAGQKCSACSYVILVGSTGTSRRIHDQLIDATSSLTVGWADNRSAQVGPLSQVPGEKLERGLTVLGAGEKWELKPQQLDETGRLWSPGIRSDVKPGSEYHMTEYFGPILGIIRVDSLEEAIRVQNQTSYGLTAGIHSLDSKEINLWLSKVQAGNVYVNRGITGAIVRRQPFGGWKLSAVGEGTKAGGPNYLLGFGHASDDTARHGVTVTKPALRDILAAGRALLDDEKMAKLERAVASDELAATKEFDILHDPSQVLVERNHLRYVPTDGGIRIGADADPYEVLRVLSAALAVGEIKSVASLGKNAPTSPTGFLRRYAGGTFVPFRLTVSTANKLPSALSTILSLYGVRVIHESKEEFHQRLSSAQLSLDERWRMVGESGDALRIALNGDISVAIYDNAPTESGRVEILPFVHEQAISITNHRFGNRSPLTKLILAD
ncbi:MAG: bifunctional proline dehydrogenase/L-glutamate gamma-semialdehyde dehydrogenase [Corynebacterium sp.]|nr:bifunctional proline dehydrogenase/L-glutamate gamma-semialdehyde dehydrogenase [Corynebacterium sp.]